MFYHLHLPVPDAVLVRGQAKAAAEIECVDRQEGRSFGELLRVLNGKLDI